MSVETRHKVLHDMDEPMTLDDACRLLFHNRIRPATLRVERDRGNLVVEKIGRREFVTRRYIKDMCDNNKKFESLDGSVYFIRSYCKRYVKIGFAKNLAKRLVMLQCGSPEPLVLIATASGSRGLELQLHRRFAELRASGEWFRLSEALKRHIVENADLHVSADEVWQ